jgi:hypothetical protein
LATPLFYSVSPFLFGPLIFIWHPPFYLVIKDQFIFICHPFAPATAILLLQVVLVLGFRSIVVCSYLQNVLELLKCAKHTINATILL